MQAIIPLIITRTTIIKLRGTIAKRVDPSLIKKKSTILCSLRNNIKANSLYFLKVGKEGRVKDRKFQETMSKL